MLTCSPSGNSDILRALVRFKAIDGGQFLTPPTVSSHTGYSCLASETGCCPRQWYARRCVAHARSSPFTRFFLPSSVSVRLHFNRFMSVIKRCGVTVVAATGERFTRSVCCPPLTSLLSVDSGDVPLPKLRSLQATRPSTPTVPAIYASSNHTFSSGYSRSACRSRLP
jgi:hypothetical protein